jgi:hypothetical protein
MEFDLGTMAGEDDERINRDRLTRKLAMAKT